MYMATPLICKTYERCSLVFDGCQVHHNWLKDIMIWIDRKVLYVLFRSIRPNGTCFTQVCLSWPQSAVACYYENFLIAPVRVEDPLTPATSLRERGRYSDGICTLIAKEKATVASMIAYLKEYLRQGHFSEMEITLQIADLTSVPCHAYYIIVVLVGGSQSERSWSRAKPLAIRVGSDSKIMKSCNVILYKKSTSWPNLTLPSDRIQLLRIYVCAFSNSYLSSIWKSSTCTASCKDILKAAVLAEYYLLGRLWQYLRAVTVGQVKFSKYKRRGASSQHWRTLETLRVTGLQAYWLISGS